MTTNYFYTPSDKIRYVQTEAESSYIYRLTLNNSLERALCLVDLLISLGSVILYKACRRFSPVCIL